MYVCVRCGQGWKKTSLFWLAGEERRFLSAKKRICSLFNVLLITSADSPGKLASEELRD